MHQGDVSKGGLWLAALMSLCGTVGHYATAHTAFRHDDEWFLIFAVSMLTLCASAVNFEPRRWFESSTD